MLPKLVIQEYNTKSLLLSIIKVPVPYTVCIINFQFQDLIEK